MLESEKKYGNFFLIFGKKISNESCFISKNSFSKRYIGASPYSQIESLLPKLIDFKKIINMITT